MKKINAKPLAEHLTACNKAVEKCSEHVDETYVMYKNAEKLLDDALLTRSKSASRLGKAIEYNKQPWWKRLYLCLTSLDV